MEIKKVKKWCSEQEISNKVVKISLDILFIYQTFIKQLLWLVIVQDIGNIVENRDKIFDFVEFVFSFNKGSGFQVFVNQRILDVMKIEGRDVVNRGFILNLMVYLGRR